MNSRAGKTRHRITITRPTTAQDAFAGVTVTHTTVGTYWAEVSRMSSNRTREFEQTVFNRPFQVTVRQYIDVREDDVITFENERLVIRGVEKDLARKRYTTILASSVYEG